MGELLQFPERKLEPLEPINESVVAPKVWQRILEIQGVDNPAVELGSD